MKTKRDHEKAVRTSISMPPELWKIATADQGRRHLSTFSDYIQELIRHHGTPVAKIAHGR